MDACRNVICQQNKGSIMRVTTIAIVVNAPKTDSFKSSLSLVEVISDEFEIGLLEASCQAGSPDPLESVREFRRKQMEEEGEFGNYVEELLSQPFVANEIQEHGVQWLKSKIRIEKHVQNESDAAKVIAEYAMKVVSKDPEKTDFFLAGPKAMVRIRVFSITSDQQAAA
jgi:hypothetical protein